MLYEEEISLALAKELCYESGIFSKTPVEMYMKVANLFENWRDIY